MTTGAFPGFRFDGRTALAQEVVVTLEARTLAVTAKGGIALERMLLDPARVSERFAAAPRVIALNRGVMLEIPDADGRFDQALAAAGIAATPVQRMQRFWPAAVAALAGLVIIMAATYVYGVPAAAHWLAWRLPAGFEQKIGDAVLVELDERTFKPSALPAERQAALTQRFASAARAAVPDVAYRLEFRNAEGPTGANALALPGGTIVLLDGLVAMTHDDDALVGVLSHELGHVAGKHWLRQLLQTIGVGALAGLLWGDFSSVIANVPLAFGVLHYSRAFEREADEFALRVLGENGISAHPLDDFLGEMDRHARDKGRAAPPAFLSTHPPTDERRQRLREAAGQ